MSLLVTLNNHTDNNPEAGHSAVAALSYANKQPLLSFASAKESSKPARTYRSVRAGKSRADFPACRQAGMRQFSSLDPHQAKIGV